jgi:hypothetical protein
MAEPVLSAVIFCSLKGRRKLIMEENDRNTSVKTEKDWLGLNGNEIKAEVNKSLDKVRKLGDLDLLRSREHAIAALLEYVNNHMEDFLEFVRAF